MNRADKIAVLKGRIAAVEQRVTQACQRAGRFRSEVTVVAVTKSISVETTHLLPELGLTTFAENRPQELWKKAEALGPGITWHFIGHLQRNKIERTLPLAVLLHSVDSVRLLEALDKEAAKQKTVAQVLLEVNTSGEANKQGFSPLDLRKAILRVPSLEHVQVQGLMTMAAFHDDPEKCRPSFEQLKSLRDTVLHMIVPDAVELSMGMTNDFEVAIESGATLVRLGTVYFEGLE